MGRAWWWWGVWVCVVVCLMGGRRGVAECRDAGAEDRVWASKAKGQDWTWWDADGCVRTRAELAEVLAQHKLWDHSHHRQGHRADLTGTDLSNADLIAADLIEADLTPAYLQGADLTGAHLHEAELTGAHLRDADLTRADLYGADLTGADLSNADLTGADLTGADLTDMASLVAADLTGAILLGTHLTGAILIEADFSGAHLLIADLTGADLVGADLTGAILNGADLTEAILGGTDLTEADIIEADLTGAHLAEADLSGVFYEPKAAPAAEDIAYALGLDRLRYRVNPAALVALRKSFQEAGFVQQARKVTASLRRSDLDHSWECEGANCDPKSLRYKLRYTLPKSLNWALFDWTCAWGSDWSHPLVLLGWLCLVCGPVYWVGLHFGRVGGIYQIVLDKVVATKDAKEVVSRVEPAVRWVGWQRLGTRRFKLWVRLVGMALRAEWRALRLAFLFSVLSALDIGFHEFNVGQWARMLLARDFNLKARGWMRVAGGVQSLVGLGLVALSLLSYFGHPFD